MAGSDAHDAAHTDANARERSRDDSRGDSSRLSARSDAHDVMAAFQRDPGSVELFARVRAVLGRAGRWTALLDAYEQAAREAPPSRAEKLWFEAGETAETRALDYDRAAALYEQSFQTRKSYLKALRALRALEESRSNQAGVLRALRLHLEALEDPARRARLLSEMGRVYEDRKRDREQALECYRQALEADPKTPEALERVETLCRRLKRFRTLTRSFKAAALKLKGEPESARFHARAGLVLAESLGDTRNASVAFRFALQSGLDDPRMLESIRDFARREDREDLLALLLRTAVGRARTESDKARSRAELAGHLLNAAEDEAGIQQAIEEARAALEEDPRCVAALDVLREASQRSGARAEFEIELLEHELTHFELAGRARAEILVRLGTMRERLGQSQGARAAFEEALTLAPETLEALRGLERLAREREDWTEYERVLAEQARLLDPELRAADRSRAAEVQRRFATLYREVRQDTEREAEALRQALVWLPGDRTLVDRLIELAADDGDIAEQARLLERQALHAEDEEEAVERLARLARLRDRALDDPAGAAVAWEQVDRRGRRRDEALAALEELYSRLDDAEALFAVLERRAARETDPAQLSRILRRQARLLRTRLDRPREAAALLKDAWSRDPAKEEALEALRELVEVEKAGGDPAERPGLMLALELIEGDADRLRAARLERAAALTALGRHAEALGPLGDILAGAPDDAEAFEMAMRALEATGEGDGAVRLTLEVVEGAVEDETARAAAARLAELIQSETGRGLVQPARAVKVWRELVRRCPDEPELLEQLLEIARAGGDRAAQDEALRRLETVAPPERRLGLLLERAAVLRSRGGDEDLAAARETLARARDLAPRNPEVIAALRSLLALSQDAEGLIALLDEEIRRARKELAASAEGPTRAKALETLKGLCLDAAEVAEVQLDDPSRATLTIEALREHGDDLEVLERLASLYRRTRRLRDLEGVLAALAERTEDEEQRIAILLEQARLADEVRGDPAAALARLQTAVEARPGDAELRLARAAARERLGDWSGALEDLSEAARVSGAEGAGLAAIARRRGLILRDRLGDDGGAEAALREAVEADAEEPAALAELLDLLERRRAFSVMEELLGKVAERCREPRRRRLLTRRRAELLATRLGRVDAALALLEDVLADHPEDQKARALLLQILRRAGRPSALAAALAAARAAITEATDAEGVAWLREEALVRAEALGELEAGRELLAEALDRAPEDRRLSDELLRLERRADRPERLVPLLREMATRQRDGARRARLLTEAGRLCVRRLGDAGGARSLLEGAVEAAREGGHRREELAARLWLERVLVELGADDALTANLARSLELCKDSGGRRRLTLRLAESRRSRGDRHGAREVLEPLAAEGDRRALTILLELLDEAGEPAALYDTAQRLATTEPDEPRRRAILLRLARRLTELGDLGRAGQAWRTLVDMDGSDIAAIRGLASVLDPREQLEELVALLARELELGAGPARALELRLRLARLKADVLGDPAAAIPELEAARALDPNNDEARTRLRECLVATSDFARLADLFEDLAQRSAETAVKEELTRQAALLCQHHLDDNDRARRLFFRVLEAGDPECVAIDALPPLLEGPEFAEDRRRLMQLTAQIVPGSARAKQALIALAREKDAEGEAEEARLFFARALGWSPSEPLPEDERSLSEEDLEALEGLLKLARRDGRATERAALLAFQARVAARDDVVQRAQLERARLLVEEDRRDEAMHVYEQVLATDPANAEAVEALLGMYSELERPGAISALLDSAGAAAETPERQAELLRRRAEHDERRGEVLAAIDSWERLARLRVDDRDLIEHLARLQEEAGEFGRLLTTLDDLAALVPDRERAAVLERKARLLAEGLGRPAEACEVLEERLDLGETGDGDEVFETLALLQELAERAERPDRILSSLERELLLRLDRLGEGRIDPADAERIERIGARIARLQVAADEPALAESRLERALDAVPDSRTLFQSLRAVVEAMGQPRRILAVLERRATVVAERAAEGEADAEAAAEVASLRADMAELLESELEDVEGAFAGWRAILDDFPGSFAALRSLQRLAWQLQRREAALEYAEAELEALEALGPTPCTGLVEDDGLLTGEDVLRQLEEAFRERQAVPARYDLRALVVDAAGATPEELSRLVDVLLYGGFEGPRTAGRPALPERFGEYVSRVARKASIVAWDLGRMDTAAALLERALFLAPDDEVVRLHLAEVHEFRQDWPALLTILRERWTRIRKPAERVSLGLRIASVEDRLGRPERGIEILETVWPDSEGDLGMLERLIELQRKTGRKEALADSLARAASLAEDVETELSARLERARLLDEDLEPPQTEGAIKEYVRILGLDIAHDTARERLCELLLERGEVDRVVVLLEEAARAEGRAARAAELLERAATLVETELGDRERAAALLATAAERCPSRLALLDRLVEVARAVGDAGLERRALELRAPRREGAQRIADQLALAELCGSERLDQAVAALESVLQLEPGHEEAWKRLISLRERGDDLLELLAVLERRAAQPADEAMARELLARASRLARELGEDSRAAKACEALLELDPGDDESLRALVELTRDDPPRQAEALARWFERDGFEASVEDDKARAWIRRLAELSSRAVYHPERAAAAWTALLEHEDERPRALENILGLLEREHRFEDLRSTLDREIARLREVGESGRPLVSLQLRRARLLEEALGDIDAADTTLRSLFEEQRDAGEAALRAEVFRARERFLRRHGRFADLAPLLAVRAEQAPEAESRRLWRELAVLQEGKLEDTEGCLVSFEKALERAPEDLDALVGIQRPLRRLERWDRLAEVYGRLIPLEEDLERRAWLEVERGVLLADRLGRSEDAIEAFEAALYIDPACLGAIRRLVGLYEESGDDEALRKVLEAEVQALRKPGSRAAALCRLGDLHRLRRDDSSAAAKCYRKALKLDSMRLPALVGLAEVLREGDHTAELAPILDALAERHPDPEVRARSLKERAIVLAELERTEEALEVWARVLDADPLDAEAVEGLLGSARELGDLARLVAGVRRAVWQRRADFGVDAVDWLVEGAAAAARLAETGQEGMNASAIELARGAFELDPGCVEAIDLLRRIAPRSGERAILVDVLMAHAALLEDREEAAAAWRDAGALARAEDRLDEAEDAYERVLVLAPGDLSSLRALEDMAAQRGDVAAVCRCLEGQLRSTTEPEQRVELARRLGETRRRSGDVAGAANAFDLALRDVEGGDERVALIRSLIPCLRQLGRHGALVELLGDGAAASSEDRIPWLLERARLLVEPLRRPDLALGVYEEVLSESLERDQRERVFDRLSELLAELGETERLEAALREEAERRGARGAALWKRHGDLLCGAMGAPERGLESYREALKLEPGNGAVLDRLTEVLAGQRRWLEVLQVMEVAVQRLETEEELVEHYLEAGLIAEESLGDDDRAARLYTAACRVSPGATAPLEALARVHERRGAFIDLARVLEELATVTAGTERELEVCRRLGRVHMRSLFHREKAIAAWSRARELAPQDPEVLESLTALLRDAGRHEDLVRLLGERRQRVEAPAEALALAVELADVLALQIQAPERALAVVDEALEKAPTNADLLHRRLTLLRGLERWLEAAQTLSRLVASLPASSPQRGTALKEQAWILREKLGRQDDALKLLDELGRSEVADESALEYAARSWRSARAHDRLVPTLERLAKITNDPFKAARSLAEVGWIHLEEGGEAEATFREALNHDPGCLPALQGLARALESAEDREGERLVLLDQIAAHATEPLQRVQARVEAGMLCRESLEDFDGARRRYQAALDDHPNCYEALCALAEMAHAEGRLDEALPWFEALQQCPDFGEDGEHAADLLHACGVTHQQLGDDEAAARTFRRALEFSPNHLASLEDLGRTLIRAGAWAAALQIFEDLVARSRSPVARAERELLLARSLEEVGQPDRALEIYRQVVSRFPENLEAQIHMARLLQSRGEWDRARACYESVLASPEIEPRWRGQARHDYADLLAKHYGDAARAVSLFSDSLADPGPHQGPAARRLAELLGHAGRWTEAGTMLQRAIDLETSDDERALLWANLGRLTRDRLGNLAYARVCFESALELRPTDAKTLSSLIRLLETLGDQEAMDQALSRAIDLAEDVATLIELRTQRGNLLWRTLRRYGDAVAEFEEVLGLDRHHAESRRALARLYVEIGDGPKALAFHRNTVIENPLEVASYRALAETFRGTGRRDAWIQALQTLVVLRTADGEERELVEQETADGLVPVDPVNHTLFFNNVLHPAIPASLARILSLTSGWTPRLFNVDLKPYGLRRRNRIEPDGDEFPQHELLSRVVELFGLADRVELYWMPEWRRPEIVIEPTEVPTLILCPAVFEGLSRAEILFLLGRTLGPVVGGATFVYRYGPNDLYRFLSMVAATLDPDLGHSADESGERRRAVRSLGKEARSDQARRVVPLIQELWGRKEQVDFGMVCQAYEMTACRCGMLAAGGAAPAAESFFKTNVLLGGRLGRTTEEVLRQIRENSHVLEILTYAISEDYLELREALGVADS